MGPSMGPSMKDSCGLRVGNMKIRRGRAPQEGWKNNG